MKITERKKGSHLILDMQGSIDLYNISQLKKKLFQFAEERVPSLVINMQKINYLDSTGIGALVAGQKKISENSGRLSLMSVNEDVMTILKLAALDKFFTIYDSEKELN